MPKVPIIEAETLPPVTADPYAVRRPWERMTGLGREVGALAVSVSETAAKIKEKTDAFDRKLGLSEFLVDITDAGSKLETELIQEADPETYRANWDLGMAAVINERLLKIEDPETRAEAKVVANRYLIGEIPRQEDYARRLWVEKSVGRLMRLLDVHARLGNLEDGYRLINGAKENGVLPADDAERLKVSFRNELNIHRVRAGMEADPSESNVKSLLAEFPVSTRHVPALMDHARVLRNELEREESKARVNAAYTESRRLWPDNYDAALKMVADPSYQKKMGLTAQEAHSVQTMLNTERAAQENRRQALYDRTAFSLYDRTIFNPDKSQEDKIAEIDRAVANRALHWRMGEHFRSAITNPPDVKSDPGVYNSILKDIREGILHKDLINERILASERLSTEDKMELGRRLYTRAGTVADEWMKKAESLIEGQIIPRRGPFATITRTPQEEIDYYTALRAFHAELRRRAEAGQPVDGPELTVVAEEIAAKYAKPLVDRMVETFMALPEIGEKVGVRMKVLEKAKKLRIETVEDVTNQLERGKLTEEEAELILRYKFKMKRRGE